MEKEKLEEYCKKYKIFIDTCSLLTPESDKFWVNIIPLLHMYNNKIIIPFRCIQEVEKHLNNHKLSERAKICIQQLNKLVKSGDIEIRGESNDSFPDNIFQFVFTKFRIDYEMLLITQDNNLAKDILALNDSKSVKANEVKVNRINKNGFLSEFYWHNFQNSRTKKYEYTKFNEKEVFKVCNNVIDLKDDKMEISEMPYEGSDVYTSNGPIRLIEEVGNGGEAKVYSTNTLYVEKIYKKDNITIRKYKKIELMLSKKIEYQGVCYPIEILYNSKNEFIGYLMPKAKGQELQKSVFGPKPLFKKKFPNWKKRDTVQLCVTILEKIKYLHDRNIIMGDINPANILVVSPIEVYFVDTDSYQVENFPCPVGTNNYTAPEIQRKHFADFLRTRGNV